MVDLVQWMYDYNQSAAEADKLSFYGFDMQNTDTDAGVIAKFCDKNGIMTTYEITPSDEIGYGMNRTSFSFCISPS